MPDFVATLMDMRNGKVAADVSRDFTELCTAVLETGGKGQITLTIDITPTRADMTVGRIKEVSFKHAVKLKKPKRPIGPSTFFVTDTGDLTRTDPDQVEMFNGMEVTQ